MLQLRRVWLRWLAMSGMVMGAFAAIDERRWHWRLRVGARWLVDLVFPPVCGGCGRVDEMFCPGCMAELRRAPILRWEDRRDGLDGLIATGKYAGGLEGAIRAFKYEGALDLSAALAERMISVMNNPRAHIDWMLPVPLSQERMAARGYNQAALLCRHLSHAWDLPWRDDALWRTRDTEQQARLRGQKRLDNVKDAFEASAQAQGRSLLLIDDVVTTGSTLIECAKALRDRGAEAVYAATVCHA